MLLKYREALKTFINKIGEICWDSRDEILYFSLAQKVSP